VLWWQYVGMIQPGGEGDLAKEPLGAEGGGQLGPEQLERDGAIVLEIMGTIDRGHPAPPSIQPAARATASEILESGPIR